MPVAKFLVPGWGYKVDYGIGLARKPMLPGGRYDNPTYAIVD